MCVRAVEGPRAIFTINGFRGAGASRHTQTFLAMVKVGLLIGFNGSRSAIPDHRSTGTIKTDLTRHGYSEQGYKFGISTFCMCVCMGVCVGVCLFFACITQPDNYYSTNATSHVSRIKF